jgi:hypothetical protein
VVLVLISLYGCRDFITPEDQTSTADAEIQIVAETSTANIFSTRTAEALNQQSTISARETWVVSQRMTSTARAESRFATKTEEAEQTAVAFATNQLLPPEKWPVVASDDFNDGGKMDWWTGVSKNDYATLEAEIKYGQYEFIYTAHKGFIQRIWPGAIEKDFTDFYMRVEAQVSDETRKYNNCFGFEFLEQEHYTYYALQICQVEYYQIDLLLEGIWKSIINPTRSYVINAYKKNEYIITMDKSVFSLWINGTLVKQLYDLRFEKGKVGLIIRGAAGEEGEIRFDNFILRAP